MGCNTSKEALKAVEAAASGTHGGAGGDADDTKTVAEQEEIEDEERFPGKSY